MKLKIITYTLGLALLMMSACTEDNYDPPTSVISGSVVFDGAPIGVSSTVDGGAGIQLELWQNGYDFREKIPVFLDQDGTFEATVFDGTYQLIPLRGSGPWATVEDSITVVVNGSASVDVPVDPFFVVNNTSFGQSGNMVTASFNIAQNIPDATLEGVTLFLGSTAIVDAFNNVTSVNIPGGDIADLSNVINLSAEVPAEILSKGYVFARVGVRTAGIGDLLYSDIEKVTL